ncbi:hypothetical protein ACFY05_32430 [Microtetraspora fusca]|uniref:Uncharacterized protein n=1 Tax=Microtetraspora fusca TaxID=1997 RepID=A0ABW6VDZ2_MICFU
MPTTIERVTITEHWPKHPTVQWTARHAGRVIARVDCPQERGMWDSDVLRTALASHFDVAPDRVQWVRAKRDGGRIIPALAEVRVGTATPAAVRPGSRLRYGTSDREDSRYHYLVSAVVWRDGAEKVLFNDIIGGDPSRRGMREVFLRDISGEPCTGWWVEPRP